MSLSGQKLDSTIACTYLETPANYRAYAVEQRKQLTGNDRWYPQCFLPLGVLGHAVQRSLYCQVDGANRYLGGSSEGPSIRPDCGEISDAFTDAAVLFVVPRESGLVREEIQSQTAQGLGILVGFFPTRCDEREKSWSSRRCWRKVK